MVENKLQRVLDQVRGADGGIKPGVKRSGTPGKQPEIEVSPRSGRQPYIPRNLANIFRSSTIDFPSAIARSRGLAAFFHGRSWGSRPRLYATVRSADC